MVPESPDNKSRPKSRLNEFCIWVEALALGSKYRPGTISLMMIHPDEQDAAVDTIEPLVRLKYYFYYY